MNRHWGNPAALPTEHATTGPDVAPAAPLECHVTLVQDWIGLDWLRWLVASAAVHGKGKGCIAVADETSGQP